MNLVIRSVIVIFWIICPGSFTCWFACKIPRFGMSNSFLRVWTEECPRNERESQKSLITMDLAIDDSNCLANLRNRNLSFEFTFWTTDSIFQEQFSRDSLALWSIDTWELIGHCLLQTVSLSEFQSDNYRWPKYQVYTISTGSGTFLR